MPEIKWTLEKLQIEALKYYTLSEFNYNSKGAYLSAHRRGLLIQICLHMKPSATKAHTNQEIFDEALKYKTPTEFQKNSKGYYLAAYRRGILVQALTHMTRIHHPKYSVKELKEEALKYNTKTGFMMESSGAYAASLNSGYHEEICSHMKFSLSLPENFLIREIQKYYPTARKFRATKLNIPEKKYIKTLEVDILIKELGKAIEFDGRYHHSFEGLKRGHPTWPEEDLRDYHKIKDQAFLSLGIQILHIKEVDWKLNKQACIDKCLKFLENSS